MGSDEICRAELIALAIYVNQVGQIKLLAGRWGCASPIWAYGAARLF